MAIQLPEVPVMVAGAVGGPIAYYTSTPARNALTLAAGAPNSGLVAVYKQVFSTGFARGWAGGIGPSAAACPAFVCVGPVFHMFNNTVGTPGACVLAGLGESLILFGAETSNAQIATNEQSPGKIKNVQPVWKPWGLPSGFAIHVFRNAVANAGLRIFCTPAERAIETVTGTSNEATKTAGSFAGNILSACLTAPVHQVYAYCVTEPKLAEMSTSESTQAIKEFVKDTYMIDGKLKPTFARDMAMRSIYCGILYTLYGFLERTIIKSFPK